MRDTQFTWSQRNQNENNHCFYDTNIKLDTDIKGLDFSKIIERSLFSCFLCCVQLWITEKSSLLLSVEEVTNMKDLATVMILQRRLNSIQRDLGPLEDKVNKFSLPFSMHFFQNQFGDLFENCNNSITPFQFGNHLLDNYYMYI